MDLCHYLNQLLDITVIPKMYHFKHKIETIKLLINDTIKYYRAYLERNKKGMRPKNMQLLSLMFINLWDLEKVTVENSFNTSADTPPRNSLFGFS